MKTRADSGFILVFVLGLCLTLAVIAISFTRAVQGELRSTTAAVLSARAEALADAGIALVSDQLASAPETFEAGLRPACELAGAGRLIVEIGNEAGKVNLNTNNRLLIEALLAGAGASRDDAKSYAAALFDYRDSDSDVQEGGAEDAEYLAERGHGVAGPKNADFESVFELDQVIGLPRTLRTRIAPWVTVHSRADGVDPDAAPEELLRALVAGHDSSGFSLAESAAFGSQRVELPPEFVSRERGGTFTIRALGLLDGGARFVREAIVEVPDRKGGSLVWQAWRQGSWQRPEAELPAAALVLPPC